MREARAALERIDLSEAEEVEVVTRRGLFVEHETYQRLSDAGLLPGVVARTLLNEVGDQVEEVTLGQGGLNPRERERPRFARLLEGVKALLKIVPAGDPTELAYAEASARRLAARRTGETLELFSQLPNLDPAAVETVRATFERWEQQAVAEIDELDERSGDAAGLRRRQAEILCRVAAENTLDELAEVGLLPERVAREAAQTLADEVDEKVAKNKAKQKTSDATVDATNTEPKDPLES